jgi:hypothetical protein
MSEGLGARGIAIPEGYERERWPWPHIASWEQARGWVTRMRATSSSREGRRIAEEAGTSWTTFKRMVRWYLVSVGEYDPETWREHVLTASACKRQYWKQQRYERDRRVARENEALRAGRDALVQQRLVVEWMEEDQQSPQVSRPRDPKLRGWPENREALGKGRASTQGGGGDRARPLTLSEREARRRAKRLREMLGPNAMPHELGLSD